MKRWESFFSEGKEGNSLIIKFNYKELNNLNMEKSSQIYDSTINTEARFNKPKSTMELISLEARDN